MLGILVGLTISWLILFLTEKQSILALGFLPLAKRSRQFFTGFIITAVLCLGVQYLEAFLKSSSWILNNDISFNIILQSFFWDVKSVFTEELIFRGALLYILIHKIGSQKSILISAIAFGIYHWFSYGVFGNIVPMVFIFIGTALMGYAWALAFDKTTSIMLPFGLHLGWNFTYNTVFSKGPLGELLLISEGGNELGDWASLFNFLNGLIIAPLIVLTIVSFFVKSEKI